MTDLLLFTAGVVVEVFRLFTDRGGVVALRLPNDRLGVVALRLFTDRDGVVALPLPNDRVGVVALRLFEDLVKRLVAGVFCGVTPFELEFDIFMDTLDCFNILFFNGRGVGISSIHD